MLFKKFMNFLKKIFDYIIEIDINYFILIVGGFSLMGYSRYDVMQNYFWDKIEYAENSVNSKLFYYDILNNTYALFIVVLDIISFAIDELPTIVFSGLVFSIFFFRNFFFLRLSALITLFVVISLNDFNIFLIFNFLKTFFFENIFSDLAVFIKNVLTMHIDSLSLFKEDFLFLMLVVFLSHIIFYFFILRIILIISFFFNSNHDDLSNFIKNRLNIKSMPQYFLDFWDVIFIFFDFTIINAMVCLYYLFTYKMLTLWVIWTTPLLLFFQVYFLFKIFVKFNFVLDWNDLFFRLIIIVFVIFFIWVLAF